MSTPLTEQERHRLWEAGDHHPEVCDCGGDDWSAEGQWCGELEETFAAVESIVDARVAAAVAAERERWREALATCACGCDVGNHWTVCSTYGCPCGRDRVRAEATTRAAALLAAEREGGEE